MAGARHFSDLIVWQLADGLRVETFRVTRRPGFLRDLKLCSQTEDAANSVCRNIAEGFGCGTHKEFARFLEIARRSVNEVQDCLRAATLKGYVAADDLTAARTLMKRLFPALNRLIADLRQRPDPPRIATRRPRTRP
jgi:four helix bundle protein